MPCSDQTKPRRIVLFDTIRGVCIIYVVIYHLIYNLIFVFGLDGMWFFSPMNNTIRNCFSGTFIFLAGLACTLSRNNAKRALRTLGLAYLITLVFFVVMPDSPIFMGILHLMGYMMLIYIPLKPLLERIPPIVGLLFCAGLFVLTYNITRHYLLMGPWPIPLGDRPYQNTFTAMLGFPPKHLSSADYYPLMPWGFLFLTGCFGGFFLKAREGSLPEWFYTSKCRWLEWCGSHSLHIYMVHQPVFMGILLLISFLMKG